MPGAYLAFKLNILRMLPIQYKYFFKDKDVELRKLMNFHKEDAKLPDNPTLLLVENNHCFGVTAENAAKDLKNMYPNSTIVYAVDHIDYSYQKNDYADAIIHGLLTNETRALTQEECEQHSIENISYLFPWEQLEEEWTTVQGKQYDYADLEESRVHSEIKFTAKNE